MEATPIAGLWSTPVRNNLEIVSPKCALRISSYESIVGKEFAVPLEPTATHWNEACTSYEALPDHELIVVVVNQDVNPCLVRVVWQNALDLKQAQATKMCTIRPGESMSFESVELGIPTTLQVTESASKSNRREVDNLYERKPALHVRVYVQPFLEQVSPIVSAVQKTIAACFGFPVQSAPARNLESYRLDARVVFDSGAKTTVCVGEKPFHNNSRWA